MTPEGSLLTLDTATDTASLGVVDSATRQIIAELEAAPVGLFGRIDELLERARLKRSELAGLVVGVGPGRYTSLRIGLASAKAVASALELPIAGVSTVDALAAGDTAALALVDARRGEVFARVGDLVCLAPDQLAVEGRICVGDGAITYRLELEARGATVPPDDDRRHRVNAAHLAGLATTYGEPEAIQPLYLRDPDAERTRKQFPQV